jgi:hypothetical protein
MKGTTSRSVREACWKKTTSEMRMEPIAQNERESLLHLMIEVTSC